MTSRIAGHLLVECLLAQGVTHAFGVPGESYLAVLDGFHLHRDRIRFITCRQEGGAAFMADAQGRLTGRPGICFVTRGPGATNASIGVHTAFQDSTPMVLFVGDVASDQRDREAFQEVDFASFLGPSTKGMAKRVERIDDLTYGAAIDEFGDLETLDLTMFRPTAGDAEASPMRQGGESGQPGGIREEGGGRRRRIRDAASGGRAVGGTDRVARPSAGGSGGGARVREALGAHAQRYRDGGGPARRPPRVDARRRGRLRVHR